MGASWLSRSLLPPHYLHLYRHGLSTTSPLLPLSRFLEMCRELSGRCSDELYEVLSLSTTIRTNEKGWQEEASLAVQMKCIGGHFGSQAEATQLNEEDPELTGSHKADRTNETVGLLKDDPPL
ncbi:hypothetical protein MLD38_008448 [Melastoma candidum]|uniref:Uncharacterized protein n=1 Tax=Melastoma candidum TaxID=119954 RepID=A0ACB9S2W2_9MYRT|nr:hypothetical protein MLD38_008448 [Melastoma candidum]